MKEVNLPSGAILKITPSPFSIAKALFQALLKEIRDVEVSSKSDIASLYKDLFCIGFSAPEVEKCLWECLKRCTYNSGSGDLRIDEQTFEPLERRDDYLMVCMEVGKENLLPFMKSLYAEFQRTIETMQPNPA